MIDRERLDAASLPNPLELVLPEDAGRITITRIPHRARPVVAVFMPASATRATVCEAIDIYSAKARGQLVASLPDHIQGEAGERLLAASTVLTANAVVASDLTEERDTNKFVSQVPPWPNPVDVGAVLDRVRDVIRKHAVLPEHGDVILTLWIAHTHLFRAFSYTPYLWLSSPTKQCGKTLVLELLELLSAGAFRASNTSPAALFRVIEVARPTLLLDEIDTWLAYPRGDEFAGILNDGFHRGGKVLRCVGDHHEVQAFEVFSPKALAGIGTTLADATRSRCIRLPMQRATSAQLRLVSPLRPDRAKRWAEPLQQQLARVGADHAEALRERLREDDGVVMPAGIEGRDAQLWEPLLAVADLGGSTWSARARDAAVAIVNEKRANDNGDVRMRALADIRAFFVAFNVPHATSDQLCSFLADDESSEWSEYGPQRKPITASALARLLKPFGLKTSKIRTNDGRYRVWQRADLEERWEQYLPSETPVTSEAAGPPGPAGLQRAVALSSGPGGPGGPADFYGPRSENEKQFMEMVARDFPGPYGDQLPG